MGMDWLTGMITGYADRSRKIEDEKFQAAREAAQRENQVFRDLLNSPNKEVASMAATGLILGSQPQKRSKGISGWMGEMQSNPIYPKLLEYMNTPQLTEGEEKPFAGLPSRQSGGISPFPLSSVPGNYSSMHPPPTPPPAPPPAPPAPGAAALPATSPTEAGAAPMTTPPPTPPGSAPVATHQQLLEAQTAQNEPKPPPAPPALGAPPQPPASAAAIGAPAGYPSASMPTRDVPGQAVAGMERTQQWQRPNVYPSQTDLQIAARRAQLTGDFEALRDIYLQTGLSPEQATEQAAQDVVSFHQRALTGGQYRSMELEWTDEQGIPHRELGFQDIRNGQYLDGRRNPIPYTVTRAMPYSAMSGGQYVTRALAELGFSRIEYMNDPAVAAQVNAVANQKQQEASLASGTGAGLARYNRPLDIPSAQAAHVPVGTTSAQVGGQIVPTAKQADRRMLVGQMATWLEEIDKALDVLPRTNSLGGLAPGAAIGVARRIPEYRAQYAILDSAINQILASLSRVVQENVGTQTDLDAQRAMDTLAQIRGNILDPFVGDTQESARARLAVTKQYLREVLQTLPATPVVPPAAGAAPAAAGGPPPPAAATAAPSAALPAPAPAPSDWTMVNGVLHYKGQPYR